jgi:2-polyprenyl-3-methyl-5-hydroxy-6-metoxy-1,4-benzoquinol methylase
MESSLVLNGEVLLIEEIAAVNIIEAYQKNLNIDISRNFTGVNTISLYKCLKTGFRFYYPFKIAGDGKFYEQLQQFDWYYMDWKWEHEVALKYIKMNMNVLEVGCAKGTFLEKLSTFNGNSVGLELNEKAALFGKKRGLNIINQTIQEHSAEFTEKYDLVCSFQVMEHIATIREVILASINVLKKGGKLIISVPNNDSFLGLGVNYLNLPPHHMGLWNEEVLTKTAEIFNLKLVSIHFEPLQNYHKKYFIDTMTAYYQKKYASFAFITKRIIPKIIPLVINLFSKKTRAFTIMGVFEKN